MTNWPASARQSVSQSVSTIDFITEVCYVTNVTNAVREKTSSVFNVSHVQSSAKKAFLRLRDSVSDRGASSRNLART